MGTWTASKAGTKGAQQLLPAHAWLSQSQGRQGPVSELRGEGKLLGW